MKLLASKRALSVDLAGNVRVSAFCDNVRNSLLCLTHCCSCGGTQEEQRAVRGFDRFLAEEGRTQYPPIDDVYWKRGIISVVWADPNGVGKQLSEFSTRLKNSKEWTVLLKRHAKTLLQLNPRTLNRKNEYGLLKITLWQMPTIILLEFWPTKRLSIIPLNRVVSAKRAGCSYQLSPKRMGRCSHQNPQSLTQRKQTKCMYVPHDANSFRFFKSAVRDEVAGASGN